MTSKCDSMMIVADPQCAGPVHGGECRHHFTLGMRMNDDMQFQPIEPPCRCWKGFVSGGAEHEGRCWTRRPDEWRTHIGADAHEARLARLERRRKRGRGE